MVSSPHVDKLNNLNYICEAGLLPRLFFSPSWCQIRKHACTRQPHYMLFGCLMRAGRKMENVPSVVCLMVGFLELSSYRRIARMEQTAPICWPLQGKNSFSARIIIMSLHFECSKTLQQRSIKIMQTDYSTLPNA